MERLNARYRGRCSGCGGAIAVGDPIVYVTAAKQAYHQRCEAAATAEAPIVIGLTVESGYGADWAHPGQTVRDRTHGLVTVVREKSMYLRDDDGDAHGLPDGGYLVTLWCRQATRPEAAPVVAGEEMTRRRKAAHAAVKQIERQIVETGEWPTNGVNNRGWLIPIEEPTGRVACQTPRLHGLLNWYILDEAGGHIWWLLYNGADGDDWSRNNLPGLIARRIPYNPATALVLTTADVIWTRETAGSAAMRAELEARYLAGTWSPEVPS